jgi:hypothetical protein
MANKTRIVALSLALAMLAAACADNRPRNGAGEEVNPNTGTVAPGANTGSD